MHLLCGGDASARFRRAIERRRLVRVLAVAQLFDQVAADGAIVRRLVAEFVGEPVGDRGVIGGGARKRLGGQPPAQRKRCHAAVPRQVFEHQCVIGGLDDDRNIAVVLGRGADHRRTADVDILDAVGKARAARHGLRERVEIDDYEVDGADVMRAQRLGMPGIVADGQKPAMYRRMQGLDATVHHFRKASEVAKYRARRGRRRSTFCACRRSRRAPRRARSARGQIRRCRSCRKRK